VSDAADTPTSHGIQALIDRLRDDGIVAGRTQAAEMLEAARREIEALRAAAAREADGLLERARAQVRLERETALGAIRLAFRDSVLQLQEEFLHLFSERLRRRVREQLDERDLMRRVLTALLLQHGHDAALSDGDLETLAVDTEARMLADGVQLARDAGGVRLTLSGHDVEFEVGDQAVATLLLSHLLPRVRRHLEGGPDAPPAPSDAER